MLVQNIQNTNNQNPSFSSVRMFKEMSPKGMRMGISVFDDGKKGLVQLTGLPEGLEPVLGNSKDAKILEGMLKNLKNKITENENIAQVRELMKGIRERFKPELEDWFAGPKTGKKYMLSKTSLDSLDDAIKHGSPEYYEKGEFGPNFERTLCFKGHE